MTVDELQEAARTLLDEAKMHLDPNLYAVAGVVEQLVDFMGTSVFRHLSNAGVQDQTKRDRDVADALLAHLHGVVLYAASAPLPGDE